MFRRIAPKLCMIAFLLWPAISFAQSDPETKHALWKPRPQTQPATSQVCFSTSEAGEVATALITAKQRYLAAEAALNELKARSPHRWGLSVGPTMACGVGTSGGFECVAGIGAVLGLRF